MFPVLFRQKPILNPKWWTNTDVDKDEDEHADDLEEDEDDGSLVSLSLQSLSTSIN